MRAFQAIVSTALLLPCALAAAVPAAEHCQNYRVIDTAYIGRDQDVLVQYTTCENVAAPATPRAIKARQANECGASLLFTTCFTDTGVAGPDPNDCHVIADALLYDSQDIGNMFTVDPAQNTTAVTMTYLTCKTSFELDTEDPHIPFSAQTYCRTDWASLLNNLAVSCSAAQNANGGLAVGSNQEWSVSFEHS